MAEESDLERTEPATGRRLEQAREEGQVPHSRELSAFLIMISAVGILWFLGGWMASRIAAGARKSLTIESTLLNGVESLFPRLIDSFADAMIALLPLLGGLMLVALISPAFLGAWIFSPKALTPKFSRLNPVNGLGRIVSKQGLVELAKAIVKAIVVGGVAVLVIWNDLDELVLLATMAPEYGLQQLSDLVLLSFLLVAGSMALVVAVDVPFQLWHYHEKLKMTRDEVKREHKEMEGDPQVKGRIRSLQREAARRRMMAEVPKADVIVTNPTHFAVALAYKPGMAAPKIIAKGRGEIAGKIRELGAKHGVPLVEAPPLARALFRWSEIGEQIPIRLYAAVAEVLAYIFQLNRYREKGGEYPLPPKDIEVPAELDPGAVNG
ncbi:MAG TPA: flagellar biosynthesis protein FlhB [Rhodocyclaceae bacterium]